MANKLDFKKLLKKDPSTRTLHFRIDKFESEVGPVLIIARTRPAVKGRRTEEVYYQWVTSDTFSFTLKAGAYAGQKKDVLCLGYNFYLIANKDLVPAWVMYDITKHLLDPQWRTFLLSLPTKGYAALDFAPDLENLSVAGVPFHAGAVKYWEEKGVKIPKALIPPEYSK